MKPRTPELKEPLSQVFRGVKREAGKPPFIHPKKTLSISTSGEESKRACNLPMLQFPGEGVGGETMGSQGTSECES